MLPYEFLYILVKILSKSVNNFSKYDFSKKYLMDIMLPLQTFKPDFRKKRFFEIADIETL